MNIILGILALLMVVVFDAADARAFGFFPAPVVVAGGLSIGIFLAWRSR